jgi:hypothetical protein
VSWGGLWTSVALVRHLVLDGADGSSSLSVSLFVVAELLEGCVNATNTNGVHWGTRSALVAALWHFLELGAELDVLRSRHNADLMEDQMGPLWIQACPASDSMASHILPSVARGPPDGAGE